MHQRAFKIPDEKSTALESANHAPRWWICRLRIPTRRNKERVFKKVQNPYSPQRQHSGCPGCCDLWKKPSKITERVVSATYGIRCMRNFIQGVHPEQKKIIVDGIEKCSRLFDCMVKENKVVKLGEKVKKIYHPGSTNDYEIHVGFFITNNPNAILTTDPGVTRIGSVVVQSPDTWRGKDRDIEVSMHFGGTEITATARDVSTGNVAQTALDFFCRL